MTADEVKKWLTPDCREKARVPMDWYNNIEREIRAIVKLLRDNGVNTVCSCGHKMTVDVELYNNIDEAERIATLLVENGYSNFKIDIWLGVPMDSFWVRRATIKFGDWK